MSQWCTRVFVWREHEVTGSNTPSSYSSFVPLPGINPPAWFAKDFLPIIHQKRYKSKRRLTMATPKKKRERKRKRPRLGSFPLPSARLREYLDEDSTETVLRELRKEKRMEPSENRIVSGWELLEAAPTRRLKSWKLNEVVWVRWESPGARSWWPAIIEPYPRESSWKEKDTMWYISVRYFDGLDTRMKVKVSALRKLKWAEVCDFVPRGPGEEIERECTLAALRELRVWREGEEFEAQNLGFESGDFVWCRIYPYPWWPAQITVNKGEDSWMKENGRMIWVEFLNSYDENKNADGWWVTATSLTPLKLENADEFLPDDDNEYFSDIIGALKLVEAYTEERMKIEEERLSFGRKRKRGEHDDIWQKQLKKKKVLRTVLQGDLSECRNRVQKHKKQTIKSRAKIGAYVEEVRDLEAQVLQLQRQIETTKRVKDDESMQLADAERDMMNARKDFHRILCELTKAGASENEVVEDMESGRRITVEEAKWNYENSIDPVGSNLSVGPLSIGEDVHARDLQLYQLLWTRVENTDWKWLPCFIETDAGNQTVRVSENAPMAHVTLLTPNWESKWVPIQSLRSFDLERAESLLPSHDNSMYSIVAKAVEDAKELHEAITFGVTRYQVGSHVWARAPKCAWRPAQVVQVNTSGESWAEGIFIEFFDGGKVACTKACQLLAPARLRPLTLYNCEEHQPNQAEIDADKTGVLQQISDACEQAKQLMYQKEIFGNRRSLIDGSYPPVDAEANSIFLLLEGSVEESLPLTGADAFADALLNTDMMTTSSSSSVGDSGEEGTESSHDGGKESCDDTFTENVATFAKQWPL